MEQRNFKKLAPAPPTSANAEEGQAQAAPVPAPRKHLTRNCDGNRPACGRCQKTGDTCLYEVNRRDIVKLQLLSDSDTARLQNLETIFGTLQNGSNHQATAVFAQIRLGESVETLASILNQSSNQPSTSTTSKQSMVSMASGESTVRNGAENSSTTVVSQGFLDLLFDRDGWLQSTENTLTQSLQTTREEIHDPPER
ncbi:hypothetical protein F4819DRAFT_499592 [Hypoxylon fuscum]|nr:hypothetical protein F4819DRAFT_499592 [Hypoxylon fuscum]